MKKFLILAVLVICLFNLSTATSATKDPNKKIIQNYVKKHYGKKWKIKYVSWTDPIVLHRTAYAKKKIIIVDVVKSKSTGLKDKRNNRYYGKIPNTKYLCWYNKKVKKGKTVTQYAIYNPFTNECDDMVAVIDCGRVR